MMVSRSSKAARVWRREASAAAQPLILALIWSLRLLAWLSAVLALVRRLQKMNSLLIRVVSYSWLST